MVYGMPRAAFERGCVDQVAPLQDMAGHPAQALPDLTWTPSPAARRLPAERRSRPRPRRRPGTAAPLPALAGPGRAGGEPCCCWPRPPCAGCSLALPSGQVVTAQGQLPLPRRHPAAGAGPGRDGDAAGPAADPRRPRPPPPRPSCAPLYQGEAAPPPGQPGAAGPAARTGPPGGPVPPAGRAGPVRGQAPGPGPSRRPWTPCRRRPWPP